MAIQQWKFQQPSYTGFISIAITDSPSSILLILEEKDQKK